MKKEDNYGIKDSLRILHYFLKLTHRVYKQYIPTLLLSSFFKAITPFINIIIPKYIIDELLGQQRVEAFVPLIGALITGNFLLNIINKWFEKRVPIVNDALIYKLDLVIGEKIMDMDFESVENPEILDLKERALFAVYNEGAIFRLVESFAIMVSQAITILGLAAIILTLNPLLIIVILIIVALNTKIFDIIQKLRYVAGQSSIPGNRAFGYFGTLTADFSLGKDIRLYDISPLIMKKSKGFTSEIVRVYSKHYEQVGRYNGISNINLQFQMTLVYGYLTYSVFTGSMGIGNFAMYAGATSSFCTSIITFVNTFIEINQLCRYLDLFMQFEGLENKNSIGDLDMIPLDNYVLQFKNVSFKYPRSDKYTLKNVSIIINKGERLSVVGLNGAGKTTFIKLLTRLYEPTEGEILLNGININQFKYQEYMKIMAVVFQDYKLLAFTVKENITLEQQEAAEDSRVLEILNKAGLQKDIEALEKGMDTSVYKNFDKEGIEFSGGQSQKLAIARALYKDSPIVILDEPTAALDPIAEYEIYNRFNQLIGGKTAIYISHRLSSCKFCDKIAVFDGGEIIQYGSHEELMKNNQSEYARMYNTQAQYYI